MLVRLSGQETSLPATAGFGYDGWLGYDQPLGH